MTIECEVGLNLYNKKKDTPEFKLTKNTIREALLCAQMQNREAIALQKAGKFEETNKGQRKHINGLLRGE